MGLDIWLEKNRCDKCGHTEERESHSYTYNVSPMWYKIYPEDDGMVQIEGMTGQESLPKLKHAVEVLETNQAMFDKLNPDNGFGSRYGFVRFLNKLINDAEENKELIWKSWR